MTATDGASAGSPGLRGQARHGQLEAEAPRSTSAPGLKFDYGSTWTFANADEAAAMRKQLDDYLVEQEILKHDPYYAIKFSGAMRRSPRSPRRRA